MSKKVITDEIAERSKSKELLVTEEEIAREFNTILNNDNDDDKSVGDLSELEDNLLRKVNMSLIQIYLSDRTQIFLIDRGFEVAPKEEQNPGARSGPASQKRKRCPICPSTNDKKDST
ncbi:hypothetical protein ANN_04261 [Periplaneta americana]|uniref:Uncharacterized protein n=1 Tax=Periplaneta americana TaxID=6978 RepID=A0ABQ8T9W6_PERAM|nr:hypothetical protein ANN_04261 [Periplaneta americana]